MSEQSKSNKKNQLSVEQIEQIKETVKLHDKDVGSTAFQIVNLTGRILHITQHMTAHRNDKHTRRGLVMLVSRRRNLMKYIKRTNPEKYAMVLSSLGLRK